MSNLARVKKCCKQSSCPPNPTIRGGSTSQGIEFDTLELSLKANSDNSALFSPLYEIKKVLQQTDAETEMPLSTFMPGTNLDWIVHRTGSSRLYPFRLTLGDITLILSERDESSPVPSALLKFGSMSCQNDLVENFKKVKDWLRSQKISVISDTVSRVDFCLDLHDVAIYHEALKLTDIKYMTSKARKKDIHIEGNDITGITIGKGYILLRMYDKIRELNKAQNTNKKAFFTQKWGKYPEKCTRVEFQLRRGALKELTKKGSFHEINHHKEELWKYLTKVWFRHTSKIVDKKNNNQQRGKVSHIWNKVQQAVNIRKCAYRVKKVVLLKSLSQLEAQVKGLFTTLLAGHGQDHNDYFGLIATAKDITERIIVEAMGIKVDWEKKFKKRAMETRLDYDKITVQSDFQFTDAVQAILPCLATPSKQLAFDFSN
ncbi:MAG: hypothetical protein OCC45_13275 [Desulfotalea sp.]